MRLECLDFSIELWECCALLKKMINEVCKDKHFRYATF